MAYSGSPKPSTHASSSSPEVVRSGLNTTTYEKQPDWAFSERSKNSSGQYRDGMFQGSNNVNNSSPSVSKASSASSPSSSYKPAASPAKTTVKSTSSTPGWAQKPVQSSFTKPASPKPAVASYQVGGQGNNQAAYGTQTGANSSPAVVKSGLNATTYEKQPDWAYAERSKNANGQYKDGMFSGSGAKVHYGASSASPSQLRAGGHLR